jgi:DNA-binding NtrC family response regulator
MALLHAIAGPLKGAIFRFLKEEVSVGRLASNQLCVGDPSISRQHCLILPHYDGFQIRDLGSNNGTFVNGDRVGECVLADGDKIRIGDTVFHFALNEEALLAQQHLSVPDNGVVAITTVERKVSDSAATAIQRLLETVGQASEFAARAKIFLRIGAALNTWQEPEPLQIELLKRILEVVPAEQAAIVLLAQRAGGDPTIIGWDRRCGEAASVPVSQTLVTKAMRDSLATFSDDVKAHQDLSGVSSLSRRRVVSVIVVPLITEGRTIGAIYLDSADPVNRLSSEDLEFTAVIVEYAGSALERATRLRALKEENLRLQSALQLGHNLIACGPAMQHISERIARIARTDATVMIRGETGTGKELAAHAIHENSARAGRPFEAINCSLLRDTLLESELFGHEKGSFTGAAGAHRGLVEATDGGTLFLDEITETTLSFQVKLLRVIQEQQVRRVGSNKYTPVNVRILAASNRELGELLKRSQFREDLYYRLAVVRIDLPSLEERREDIPLLVRHFLRRFNEKDGLAVSIDPAAVRLLQQLQWPGNVRELENTVNRLAIFAPTGEITLADVEAERERLPQGEEASVAVSAAPDRLLELERQHILQILKQTGGNRSEAARRLGIERKTLYRKALRLGIDLQSTGEK